jgi:hypothetical protein
VRLITWPFLGNGSYLQQQTESEEIGEALLFLAKYEMDRFRYREATEYAKIAADFPYPVSWIKSIESRKGIINTNSGHGTV